MPKKYAIITEDALLRQRIRLELSVLHKNEETEPSLADFVFCDTDGGEPIPGSITLSRGGDADLPIPIPFGALSAAMERRCSGIVLFEDERCAEVLGRRVRLTEIEFRLLSLLVSRSGEFVSREEILDTVWGEGTDGGVINVYVHYLREKLECSGEKIILSSRRGGYAIDGKFLNFGEGGEFDEA